MSAFSPVLENLQRFIYCGQHWLVKLFQMDWLRWYIRVGHGAKGMLYGLIGLFVINDMIHDQPIVSGSEGVLAALGNRPLGSIMLMLLALGLVGYTIWRLIQAGINPGRSGKLSFREGLQRSGYLASGLAYLGIAQTAGRLALHLAVDFDDTLEDTASFLFEREIGPWVLLAMGLGVVGVGFTYLYGAVTGQYISDFRRELYRRVTQWAVLVGKVGITARGVGFMLIGLYLMKAAYHVDDDPAGGLGKVLDQLDDEPFGQVWLGAIAFGFIAYAIYMVMAAFYRKFPTASK
jgi:hypothetical protein